MISSDISRRHRIRQCCQNIPWVNYKYVSTRLEKGGKGHYKILALNCINDYVKTDANFTGLTGSIELLPRRNKVSETSVAVSNGTSNGRHRSETESTSRSKQILSTNFSLMSDNTGSSLSFVVFLDPSRSVAGAWSSLAHVLASPSLSSLLMSYQQVVADFVWQKVLRLWNAIDLCCNHFRLHNNNIVVVIEIIDVNFWIRPRRFWQSR